MTSFLNDKKAKIDLTIWGEKGNLRQSQGIDTLCEENYLVRMIDSSYRYK